MGISGTAAGQASKEKSPVLAITNGSAALPAAQNTNAATQTASTALVLVDANANGVPDDAKTPANAVMIPTKRCVSSKFLRLWSYCFTFGLFF